MINYNIRIYAFAILGLAFGTYIILFLFTQDLNSIDPAQAISNVSTTISINIILWIFFIKWIWKWQIFYPWLVSFPNLSGKWSGYIKSNWEEKNLDQIPIEVTIVQTFFNVQISIKTEESSSYSVGASFNIDKDRGLSELYYSYLNTPRSGVRDRSEIHYGSTLLTFEGFNVKEMEGEYWTSRKTTGEIKLEKKNKLKRFIKMKNLLFTY